MNYWYMVRRYDRVSSREPTWSGAEGTERVGEHKVGRTFNDFFTEDEVGRRWESGKREGGKGKTCLRASTPKSMGSLGVEGSRRLAPNSRLGNERVGVEVALEESFVSPCSSRVSPKSGRMWRGAYINSSRDHFPDRRNGHGSHFGCYTPCNRTNVMIGLVERRVRLNHLQLEY